MNARAMTTAAAVALVAGFLAACGDEDATDRSEDRLIEAPGVERDAPVKSDPTPQAGEGGAIPYNEPERN